MNKRFSYITILILLLHFTVNAQYDSIIQRYQNDFERYKQSREQEFQNFKNRNDSLFYEFLKGEWKSFKVYYKEKPKEPIPAIQPFATEEEIKNHRGIEIFPESDSTEDSVFRKEEIKINSTKNYNGNIDIRSLEPVTLNYYNNKDLIYLKQEKIAFPEKPTPENIRKFYQKAESSGSLIHVNAQLNLLREKYRLNDWGFIQLTHLVSKSVCSDPNSQILLVWYIMQQNEFNINLGYSGNEIFLLIASFDEITNVYYVKVKEELFYIFNSSLQTSKSEIKMLDGIIPGSKKLSLKIEKLPEMANQKINHEFKFRNQSFTVDLNKTIIDFFNDYPECDLGIYFNTPLSMQAVKSLDIVLKPILAGKTNKEKVALILKFVQETWKFATDAQQFNREKYMFPDEVLNYSKSDCEDRAVIFVKLVKHYTGLNAIGISYPGHVAAAVNLNETIREATFFQVDNKKFVVCDPSCMGADIGYISPILNKVDLKPKIIRVK